MKVVTAYTNTQLIVAITLLTFSTISPYFSADILWAEMAIFRPPGVKNMLTNGSYSDRCHWIEISILLLFVYNFLNKIDKNEMGGTCSAYTAFGGGDLRQRVYLGDPGVNGRI